MSEMISIAIARAKPDRVHDLERELLARVEPTRAQPGNLEFSLHRLAEDPTSLVAIERWASREQWEKHLQGEHVTSLMAVFDEILASPPQIQVLTPLRA
jgi:quinol monooxygenase YgiN